MNTYNNIICTRVSNGLRWLLMLIAVTVASVADAQERDNRLVVGDFVGAIDKVVNVPVQLENSDEVVAVQFEVTLPFDWPSDVQPTLTNRSNQHSVNIHSVADRTYRVVVMSMRNNALRGNSGLLLRLPMRTFDDGDTNTPYDVTIDKVVLTDRQGNNIATETTAEGHFIVSRDNIPDLIVPSVQVAGGTLNPGDWLDVAYTVKNDGTGPTLSGWTEKIYLTTPAGVNVYIGSQAYTATLAKGMSLERQAHLQIPTPAHADGDLRVTVEVVPNADTGELIVDQGNNSGTSATTFYLTKHLLLTANKNSISEGSYYRWYTWYEDYATMTLTRTGDWTTDETFTIDCSVSGLFTVNHAHTPCNVTIPAGSSGVSFNLYVVDDNTVRASRADIIAREAHGYDSVTYLMNRTDNDREQLTLTASATTINEGQQLTLTATRTGELAEDLTLEVGCSHASRFSSPRVISIPAGKSTGSVTLTAINDDTPQLDCNVRFTVGASFYNAASIVIRLNDDDRPALTLNLSPSTVSENAGNGALTATIRQDGPRRQLTVEVTCSRDEAVPEKWRAVIPADADRVEVPISITDNNDVDGTRTCTVTAALFVDADGRAASPGDRACPQGQFTIVDDETPYLTLTSNVGVVGEGSSASVTVRRYVPSFNGAMTVSLASSDAQVTVPQTVTIPSGSAYTTFSATAARNETEGDDRPFTISAVASGIEGAQLSLRISDRTLPDAASSTVSYEGERLFSGMPATVYVEIHNEGTAPLPAGMTVNFYLADRGYIDRYTRSIPFFSATTAHDLAIGESRTMQFTGDVPQTVGTYWLYAKLNEGQELAEFSYSNNTTRTFAKVFIAAPFSVTALNTDKSDYLPGELAIVDGTVSGQLNGQTVRVGIRGNGQDSYSDCIMDSNGAFNTTVPIERSAGGMMTVSARALGQTDDAEAVQIHVYNMALGIDDRYITTDENYPFDGVIRLTNRSAKPITGLQLSHTPLPQGCELTMATQLADIAGGQTVNIPFRVNPTKSMTSGQYQIFTVKATSAEGLSAELPLYYYCRPTSSMLVANPSPLSTTLLIGTTRTVEVSIKNCGLKATGAVAVSVPSDLEWLTSLSPQTLPSIAPGATTTLKLQLTHRPGMHSGQTFRASVQLTPEEGPACGLTVEVKVVGTEYSQLDVYMTDIYTRAANDFSHVSAALVSIYKAYSKELVMTGLTDGNGHWMTEKMTEGSYYVVMSAPRHRSVTMPLTVGPGEDRRIDAFLPYQAVMTDFIVDQDYETGEYTLTSNIDVDYDAPQGIVLAQLPEGGFECGKDTAEILLTNVGLYAAQNPRLLFPQVEGCTIEVMNGFPDKLFPQENYRLRVAYEGPEEGVRRIIAMLRMHYDFTLRGELLGEDDDYQCLVGCGNRPPVVDPTPPTDPDAPDGGDAEDPTTPDYYGGGSENNGEAAGPETKKALPAYNSWFELIFPDVSSIETGEPFECTLKVVNGQDTGLRDIRFTPMVDDADTYDDATECFSIVEGETTGFVMTNGSLTLPPQTEGTMKLIYTPTRQQKEVQTYLVGGQLSYTDAKTVIGTSATLAPVMLTVRKSSVVHVTYLLQRHFMGDDATTEENETAVPSQFVMLVQNGEETGCGQLSIVADQPSVVNNAAGEPLPYTVLYAEKQGREANIQMDRLTTDSIDGGQTWTARWFAQTQQMGHLANFGEVAQSLRVTASSDVKVVIDGTRELLRTICDTQLDETPATDGSLVGTDALDPAVTALVAANTYLLNDIEDMENLPDNVLSADGLQTQQVQVVSSLASITGSGGNYTLTLQADSAGWVYAKLHDPTNGTMVLESITRNSDEKVIPAANCWQTDRTVQSNYDVIYENNLHIADHIAADSETYTLHFGPRPGEKVKPVSVRLYDANGTEVADGETVNGRVTRIVADFSRDIRGLYNNCFIVTARDNVLDPNQMTVTREAGNVWSIDMSGLEPVPGLHTVTILGDKVKDTSKVLGEGTISASWTEDNAAKVHLTFSVLPGETCGTIDRQTGDYDYGKLTAKATPAEGYELAYWTLDGAQLATTADIEIDVTRDAEINAVFTPLLYKVTIACDEEKGYVSGAATGFYAYGDSLRLAAFAKPGFVFTGWECDGSVIAFKQTMAVVVDGERTYTATFADNFSTAISDSGSTVSTKCDIYDLTGRKVCTQVADISRELKNLPPGIYIVGHKKIAVRR